MQTKTIRQGKDIVIINTDWEGGHLQEEIECSYEHIVSIFGRQNIKCDGYKTDAEWEINIPAGKGTIYNYKDGKNYLGKKNGLAIKDITNWHIGGTSPEIAQYIINELNKKL